MEKETEESSNVIYRSYPARWGVLFTVFFLNISNNALWISYSSVADYTAGYYEKEISDVDLLSSIGFFVGIPFCLASTWIVDKLGLKSGIYLGTILTFLGGLIRGVSTLPFVANSLDRNTQFWLGFVGQTLTGMGNPMAVSVPTKVSQHWFPESQRTVATIALAMSLPLGIVLGQGFTPLFVNSSEDVPTMNWVFMIPSALTMLLCIITVRTSKPPTPPSKSASFDQASLNYLSSMKKLFTNPEYLYINLAIGGAVGFFNCFATQLQQMMCSRGYSNTFSGLCGSLLLGSGFLGSIVTGIVADKTGKLEEVAKIFYCLAALMGLGVTGFLRMPDQEAAIITFCTLFGIFGFGMYPIGLELSVEATYPIDESAGTAIIFLSGQIQGGILIAISGALEGELNKEAQLHQACGDEGGGGKDHSRFLMFISGYLSVITIVFVIGLKSVYRRKIANQVDYKSVEAINPYSDINFSSNATDDANNVNDASDNSASSSENKRQICE